MINSDGERERERERKYRESLFYLMKNYLVFFFYFQIPLIIKFFPLK